MSDDNSVTLVAWLARIEAKLDAVLHRIDVADAAVAAMEAKRTADRERQRMARREAKRSATPRG